jgi:hypothetical protein
METEITRRDFLYATAATGAVMFAGDFPHGVSWAQGPVRSPEAEKIVITVITDNLADMIRPSYKIAKRHVGPSILESALHAEHGLAYQIETVVNGGYHS